MNIKSNYFFNTINQLLTMVVSIITVPYVSRVLGATNIGIYSYTYSIAAYFVMFIVLGLNNYGNREVAKVKQDQKTLNRTFTGIYAMQFICGCIVLVAYVAYVIFIVKEYKGIFYLQLLYVISGILDINWAMYGLEEFKVTSVKNMILTILNFIAIFIFVKNENSLHIYTFILSMGFVLNQLVAWRYIRKRINFCKISLSEIYIHIKPNLILFVPIVAVSLYKIMDKIMLGKMSNMAQVGFYESSEKIIRVPTVLVSSLGTVMLPRMSSLYANGNFNKGEEYIRKSIGIAILLSSSLCFGIMAISREFVPLFYGNGYEECVYIYLALLPSCLFLAFSSVIRTQYLIPVGRDKVFIKAVIAGAIVNILFNLILIPKMNAVGAALGTFMAETSVCISQAIDIRDELPIKQYLINSFPFVMLGIVMFAIIYVINFKINLLLQLLVKIVIGVFIYVVGTIGILWIKKDLYSVELEHILRNKETGK